MSKKIKSTIQSEEPALVSVIIPFYQSEDFIRQCVDSVLDQTYKNLEIILIDDESPDNCGKICDEYAKKDKRVIVVHRKNGGVCEARNSGLEIAKGKYLMFIDGDDWLANDCVEYLVKIMEDSGAEMSMTDCVFSTRGSDMEQNLTDNVRVLSPEDATCEIIYMKTPVGPWNKLYSMSVVKSNNLSFSVKWFGEGLYFSAMNAQLSRAIAYGHRKVYVYRKNNPNSGTTLREVKNGVNALDNIKYIKEHLAVKTDKTLSAANWHIWNNSCLLLAYIISANARDQYMREFDDARKYVRYNSFNIALASDVKTFEKIKIFIRGIFPVLIARHTVRQWERITRKDFN